MKLIFCPLCEDVRKLHKIPTYCFCKKSYGWYLEDGLKALIGGKAVALGVDNITFARALRKKPKTGMGPEFAAWVFPEETQNIASIKKGEK